MSVGVLNQKQIFELINGDPSQIKCENKIELAQNDIDPSAIDLPLGNRYWTMKASCRARQGGPVIDLIQKYKITEHELTKHTKLERDTTYLIELPWQLALKKNICARATAKSSIGRLDVLVRLVADKEAEFETVSRGRECRI